MNTQENNKLIAEFMGIIPNEAGVYHVSEHKGYSLENLLYHTSWDWLMPVLKKMKTEGASNEEMLERFAMNAIQGICAQKFYEAASSGKSYSIYASCPVKGSFFDTS